MILKQEELCHILVCGSQTGVSDIFITEGRPVYWRHNGRLTAQGEAVLDKDTIEAFYASITSREQQMSFIKDQEADFTWSYQQWRYRIHIYRRMGEIAMAVRLFPPTIPHLDELGQANLIRQFMDYEDGLLLVTGATGAGKTTTMAAMLAEYNRHKEYHILTLEDPVEYLDPAGRCLFSQQERGRDFRDYRRGIISAMRENPDIIMLAELRDGGTCEAALSAAASGHYVIATMHTGGVVETVERFISMFDSSRQTLARSMLAASLRGICCQKLVRGRDNTQHAAVEVLHSNKAVSNIIRTGQYEQLVSVMQAGHRYGMQTMEMALTDLREQQLLPQGS